MDATVAMDAADACPPRLGRATERPAHSAHRASSGCLREGTKAYAKDSGRYKVANCTQAQPVFYGFAGLPDGKVILVSVLSVARRSAPGERGPRLRLVRRPRSGPTHTLIRSMSSTVMSSAVRS